MMYIASDTSKRKNLSTRGGAEFSSDEGAKGRRPPILFEAFALFVKQIHISFRPIDERERRRASEDALAEYPDYS
jgi:hypothetical protein